MLRLLNLETNANFNPGAPETASKLLSLPPELKLKIYSYLDVVDSTCLNLSCKALHGIDNRRTPRQIPLYCGHYIGKTWVSLSTVLEGLITQTRPNWVYNKRIHKFVTRQRSNEINEPYWRSKIEADHFLWSVPEVYGARKYEA